VLTRALKFVVDVGFTVLVVLACLAMFALAPWFDSPPRS
jgi:hypothetical protein